MNIYMFITVFLILLFLRVPIGLVMMASSALYFLLHENPFLILSLPEKILDQLDEFVLMAIPFFMLAGEIMNHAKLTDKLFDFANMLLGWLRGGYPLGFSAAVTGVLSRALLSFLLLGFINVLMLGFIDELTLFLPRYWGLL